jgi:hypothetical protein
LIRLDFALRSAIPEAIVGDEERGAVWDFSAPGGPRLVPSPYEVTAEGTSPDAPTVSRHTTAGTFGVPDWQLDLTARPVGPPTGWLALSAACVVIAFGLGVWGGGPAAWLVGWLAGGFVSVGLLAVFTLADSRRRADPWYGARPLVSRLRTALVLLAAATICLNAWRLADWVSRR